MIKDTPVYQEYLKLQYTRILRGEMHQLYNKMWINNGIDNIAIDKNAAIPENWKKGKLFKNIDSWNKLYHNKGVNHINYGMKWICNSITGETLKIKKDEEIPEGWFLGRKINNQCKQEKIFKKKILQEKQIDTRNSQYGKIWITNGIQNEKLGSSEKIPEGWYKGRVIKQKTKTKHSSNKIWIVNPILDKRTLHDIDKEIPVGWIKGMRY